MTETKTEALAVLSQVPDPASTYQTVVRPHQLRRGDVFTETPYLHKHSRSVIINRVVHGEITYGSALAPVLFVDGVEIGSGIEVHYTKTSWEFLEVTRIGAAPTFRRATKALDQFVY